VRDIKKSLITANMQSKTGFPSSHQLNSYVAPKRRAVLSADAGLLVIYRLDRVCQDYSKSKVGRFLRHSVLAY